MPQRNKTHRLSNKNQKSYYLIASSSSYMGYWSIFYTCYCTLFFLNINAHTHASAISHTQISNANLMVLNILIFEEDATLVLISTLCFPTICNILHLIKNEICVHTTHDDWHVIKLGLEFDLVLRLSRWKRESH